MISSRPIPLRASELPPTRLRCYRGWPTRNCWSLTLNPEKLEVGLHRCRVPSSSARASGRAHASLPARLSLLLEPIGARPAGDRARYLDLGQSLSRGGGTRSIAGPSVRR